MNWLRDLFLILFPRNTKIENVEYVEVEKEGFTQIYANGALGCIVTRSNRNDEVILWPDYHRELARW